MSDGVFKIVSIIDGKPPTGINPTLPAFQTVRLGEPVQNWGLSRFGDVFRLSVGGYAYTGVIDGKVTASINPKDGVEWHATYREDQDAYTIEPAEDSSKGWTVSPDLSKNPAVEISPIISTRSDPPQFLPTQLFSLVRVDE